MKKILYLILIAAGVVIVIRYTAADEQLDAFFTGACNQPLAYTIGHVSPRYQLSESTLKKILREAGQTWSSAANKQLFRYSSNEGIKVNIIYDDQQRFLDQEQAVSSRIEQEKNSYENAKETLRKLKKRYTRKKEAFDEALKEYNKMMEKPSGRIHNDITGQAHEIEQRRRELNDLAQRINEKVQILNRISERINRMVAQYNTKFDTTRQYSQGDYQKKFTERKINIYSYRTLEELKLVLAHEMGHALGLKHVDNPESIMYYLIKDQPPDRLKFTAQDRAALRDLCSN